MGVTVLARRVGVRMGVHVVAVAVLMGVRVVCSRSPALPAPRAPRESEGSRASLLEALARRVLLSGKTSTYLLRFLTQSISVAGQANQIVASWGFQACVF